MSRSDEAWELEVGQAMAADLRHLRTSVGLSQEEMAAICGCSRNTIVTLERNAYNAKARYIMQYRKLATEKAVTDHRQKLGEALVEPFRGTVVRRLRDLFGG